MLGKLLVVVVLMFGFGYALVPMYRAICDALGINVLSLSEQRRDRPRPGRQCQHAGRHHAHHHRRVRRQCARALGLQAGPGSVQVHPGELATVMYEFRNMQNRTMAAQAIPSYAPKQAMAHFNKLECFCFNEYTLAPGESKQWPVVFVIDPKLPKDVTHDHAVVHLLRGRRQDAASAEGGLRRTAAAAPGAEAVNHPQPGGLKEAVGRPASLLQTLRAVAWSFFGIRRSAGHAQDVQKLNPVHVIMAGVVGAALFVLALVLLVRGSSAAAWPPERAARVIRFQNFEIRGETRCRPAHTRGATPYYFVPAPSRYPVLVAIGLFFVILGAGQWINGHGWGAYSLLLGMVIWLTVLFQWFSDGHRRERRRPVFAPHRRLLPLEHELVHLLGGDVLRRLLRRAVLGARARGADARQPGPPDPVARLQGRLAHARWPASRPRRPAPSSPSRPWARGRCRRSTPRCC